MLDRGTEYVVHDNLMIFVSSLYIFIQVGEYCKYVFEYEAKCSKTF